MGASNLIQFLTYAAMLASSIFIPLMAESFGATPSLVGLIVGAYNTCFFLSSYIFGNLADRYGGRYVLRLGLLLAALFFTLQIFSSDVLSLFYWRALAGVGAGIFPAALAVYAYTEHRGKMGQFAGYGSLGWAVGAILAGLITTNQTIFIMSGIFFFLAFLLSLQMDCCFQEPIKRKVNSIGLIKKNARVYIPYFFRALGAQAVWAVFPLYLVFTGADKLWVGIAYFVNTGSQFFMMQYVEKYHNLYLFNIGLLATVLTFIGYALFPSLPVVLFFQLLLAFSFSTLQVGAVQELLSNNSEQSTAMSILNSIVNITAVIGPLLAGFVLQYSGFSALMWLAAGLTFIGLVSFTKVLD